MLSLESHARVCAFGRQGISSCFAAEGRSPFSVRKLESSVVQLLSKTSPDEALNALFDEFQMNGQLLSNKLLIAMRGKKLKAIFQYRSGHVL
jgi:hypothetical protein